MTETNPFLVLENRILNLEALLLKVLAQNTPQPKAEDSSDQLLTVEEAAKFLKLAVATLYGLVQRRAIPVCKKGKRLYFSKKELIDWVRHGRKKTRQELEAETAAYKGLKGKRTKATA